MQALAIALDGDAAAFDAGDLWHGRRGWRLGRWRLRLRICMPL
jgi:hypothetical protein